MALTSTFHHLVTCTHPDPGTEQKYPGTMAGVTEMTCPDFQDTGCSSSYIAVFLIHFWCYHDVCRVGPFPAPFFPSLRSFLPSFHFLSFFLNIALSLSGHLNLRIGVSQNMDILCLLLSLFSFWPSDYMYAAHSLSATSLLTCPSHDLSLSLNQSGSKKVTCWKPKNHVHRKFSEVVVKISASKLRFFSSTSL